MNDKTQTVVQEVDDKEFNDFYDMLETLDGMSEEERISMAPDSRLKSRQWVAAHEKLEDEISYLKDEYLPAIMERFIQPIKEKIAKHEQSQDFIKSCLLQFLDGVGESKVNFPDLGVTISKCKGQPKIVYPDNEKEIAEKMGQEGNVEFLHTTYTIDKKKVMDQYKETKKIAIDGAIIKDPIDTLRVTHSKKKQEKDSDA